MGIPEQVKVVGDVVSVTTVGATLMSWLPHIAAALSIIWMLIRIYETKTVQKVLKRNKVDV